MPPAAQRPLGRSNVTVSTIGLGCMGMSDFYGSADDARSVDLIRYALDQGVNFFDTADMYGPHTNERLVGRALAGRRDEAVIATKFGVMRTPEGGWLGINGRPEYVRASCDASLGRLGVDTIDLYYQHRVDPATPVEDTVGAMAELVAAGKVRFLGLSDVGYVGPSAPDGEGTVFAAPLRALRSAIFVQGVGSFTTGSNGTVPCTNLRALGDIDLDGRADFTCQRDDVTLVVFGEERIGNLTSVTVEQPAGSCSALHPVGDVDDDGWADLAAVDPCVDRGAIYLLPGPFGRSVDRDDHSARILGPASNDWRRYPEGGDYDPVTWPVGDLLRVVFADVTGDGVTDAVVGVPASDIGEPDGGALMVIPGPWQGAIDGNGAEALVVGGRDGGHGRGDRIGTWLFSPGDLDQDGAADIIYAGRREPVIFDSYYETYVGFWTSGNPVGTARGAFDIPSPLGLAASGGDAMGDVTGDGVDDFVLWSTWSTPSSFVYSGAEVLVPE